MARLRGPRRRRHRGLEERALDRARPPKAAPTAPPLARTMALSRRVTSASWSTETPRPDTDALLSARRTRRARPRRARRAEEARAGGVGDGRVDERERGAVRGGDGEAELAQVVAAREGARDHAAGDLHRRRRALRLSEEDARPVRAGRRTPPPRARRRRRPERGLARAVDDRAPDRHARGRAVQRRDRVFVDVDGRDVLQRELGTGARGDAMDRSSDARARCRGRARAARSPPRRRSRRRRGGAASRAPRRRRPRRRGGRCRRRARARGPW